MKKAKEAAHYIKKKSQAAMEFLLTYGWAILVVLVVIGALAYFGVLNPSRLLPNKCTFKPGVSCQDFAITYNNFMGADTSGLDGGISGIAFDVVNGLGENVYVKSITITNDK